MDTSLEDRIARVEAAIVLHYTRFTHISDIFDTLNANIKLQCELNADLMVRVTALEKVIEHLQKQLANK